MTITTIGLDLAKNVFQVHGVDERGNVVLRKQLRRDQVRRSSHRRSLPRRHRSMRRRALLGRQAHRAGPPSEDDGAAVRQALRQDQQERLPRCRGDLRGCARPNMRFVPVKSPEQQSVLALHTARESFVHARSAQANQIRGLLIEFGLVIPQGIRHLYERVPDLIEDASNELPGGSGCSCTTAAASEGARPAGP